MAISTPMPCNCCRCRREAAAAVKTSAATGAARSRSDHPTVAGAFKPRNSRAGDSSRSDADGRVGCRYATGAVVDMHRGLKAPATFVGSLRDRGVVLRRDRVVRLRNRGIVLL